MAEAISAVTVSKSVGMRPVYSRSEVRGRRSEVRRRLRSFEVPTYLPLTSALLPLTFTHQDPQSHVGAGLVVDVRPNPVGAGIDGQAARELECQAHGRMVVHDAVVVDPDEVAEREG